jgi:HAD superfamily hydrolase (TIGR01509 family)
LNKKLKAVVFDMDGVIVDSEHQWRLCETELFRRHVPSWGDADHDKIVGMGVEDLHRHLTKNYGLTATYEVFMKECHDLACQVYGTRVTCTSGFTQVVDALRKAGLKVGLASSSPRAWIDMVIERFELAGHFDAQACADDVPSGKTKPEPDLYLLCCKRLGVEPKDALAVEDSVFGVAAAKRAGLLCAAFRNGHNDEQNLSKADFELKDLALISTHALS